MLKVVGSIRARSSSKGRSGPSSGLRFFSNARRSRSEGGSMPWSVPRRGSSTTLTGAPRARASPRRPASADFERGSSKICCRSLNRASIEPSPRGSLTSATVRIPVSLVGRIATPFSDRSRHRHPGGDLPRERAASELTASARRSAATIPDDQRAAAIPVRADAATRTEPATDRPLGLPHAHT
jgi:hypothetical protein